MATDPDNPPEPRGPDKANAVRSAPVTDEPPPDAGEPMGARDDRPPMLGRRFDQVLAAGVLTGLVLAEVANAVFRGLWVFREENNWSWFVAGFLGIAVGAGVSMFLYGVTTDRDDLDTASQRRGRADVTTEGEESRSKRRLRRRTAGSRQA
ncbi:MAG: hypothetical protein QOD65_3782 [Gaiellales bacterium]|jgi:hypothetical protein|nr:hypothetical protein [Gaiellales bacterium]MDX6596215.1 hypothetical protein [Gaiellales bacterium]